MSLDNLSVSLETNDFDSSLIDIHSLVGDEHLGQLFSFDVEFIYKAEDGLDLDVLAGAEVDIVFAREDREARRIHGIICEVTDSFSTEASHIVYRVKIVPRLWCLTLCKKTFIYMNKTIEEILADKLQLAGLGEGITDHEFRLRETYPSRSFILQYEESDFHFLSRLCEYWGITYFFEHDGARDKIVFTDQTNGFFAVSGDPTLRYRRRGEEIDIYDFSAKRSLIPSTYVCRDYNYRTPAIDLHCETNIDSGYGGGIVEYGGHFKTEAEGNHLVKVRAEERQAKETVYSGRSTILRMGAGKTFTLTDHPQKNPALTLVHVRHHATQTVGNVGSGTERTYTNEFTAIDSSLMYRPPRDTPKPVMPGMVTAFVQPDIDGEVGKVAKIDSQGRYTVRFLFDLDPSRSGDTSRPIRKLQPSAGPNYGMHFPLRPGVEVLIAFVNGDPDRPVIVGSVPNILTPSPVTDSSATKNRIQTESGCLIEIEDGSGSA